MEKYSYDAVIVLGGGLHKIREKFYPTNYRQGDDFGMLGGGMRIVAAIDLYFKRRTRKFVFSTGITKKNKSQYGENIPTEAETYRKKFLRSLASLKKQKERKSEVGELETPECILEDRSFSTLSNIKEILQLVQDNTWHKIAIISNSYHIPRVKALYEQALEQHPELDVEIIFISAEDEVKTEHPGKYNKIIEKAYKTPGARERIKNEQKGLDDIKKGRYALKEFQLVNLN